MSEKVGIDNLSELSLWTANVLNKTFDLVSKAKQGKRITGWDSFKFVNPLFNLMGIIAKHKELGKEWVDLDGEEKLQLQKYMQDSLDFEDKFAEELAERTYYVLMEVGDLITFISEKTKN